MIREKGIWWGFMWGEFQFIEHGKRRTRSGRMHGFAAGGAYAGHRYSQTECEGRDCTGIGLMSGV